VRSQYHTSMRNGNIARKRLVNRILYLALSGTRIVHKRNFISFCTGARIARSGDDSAKAFAITMSDGLRRLIRQPIVRMEATTGIDSMIRASRRIWRMVVHDGKVV
jgi:hypothetical protein